MPNEDVRCPNCQKKLGECLESGVVEFKRGGHRIEVVEGVLECARCQRLVTVRASAGRATVATHGVFRAGGGGAAMRGGRSK